MASTFTAMNTAACNSFKLILQAAGDGNKPVFMEEAYYNDQVADMEIKQARSVLHMNIRFIMQWPEQRGAVQQNFSVQFPADYSAYLQ